jgi:hypothetical protein
MIVGFNVVGRTVSEGIMRRLNSYIKKYGPEAGPELYRVLQSQAAHAGVSARLRRKIESLSASMAEPASDLPLFPEPPVVPVEGSGT